MAGERRTEAGLLHRDEMDDTDVETALLTLLATQDVGPATESIRLDKLSSIEKRVVLQMMRDRIGYIDSDGQPRRGEGTTEGAKTL